MQIRAVLVACLVSFASAAAFAQADLPAPAVKDAFTPLGPGRLKIGGYVGSKLDLCIQNRVSVQKLQPLIQPLRAPKPAGPDDRRGEYWGLWADSMALACVHQPSAEHLALLEQAMQAAMDAAKDNPPQATQDPRDVSSLLMGLLACHQRTGSQPALDAAAKAMDALLAQLDRDKTSPSDLGPARLKGLAGGALLRPAVLLYSRTGQKKYLDLAHAIVESWGKPSKLAPAGMNLVQDALAGKPPREMVCPAAREQLACFLGLITLYRMEGEAKYLQAAVKFAQSVQAEEGTIVGPTNSGGMWFGGAKKQTAIVDQPMDTRVTAEWMRLVYELLRTTGESRWADELEKTLLNGLLGAMASNGDWWAAYTPLMGERVPSDTPYPATGVSGAVLAGPGGLLLTPAWAVMATPDGFVVNLYFDGRADLTTPKGKPLRLVMEARYPQTSRVVIRAQLDQKEEFTLALRVPGWSQQTTATVQGEVAEPKAGEYLTLRRVWADGDRVELTLDTRGRVVEAPDGNGQVALVRGPVVLAMDSRLVPAAESIRVRAGLDRSKGSPLPLMLDLEVSQRYGVLMGVETPFVQDGRKTTFMLCDYASAGKLFSGRNLFRTYLPPALNMGKPYDTGVTWQKMTITPTAVRPRAPGK